MKLIKSNLKGSINLPKSKSHMIRALYSSLLLKSKVKINIKKVDLIAEDIKATLNILKDFNVDILIKEDYLIVDSSNCKYDGRVINCNESATALRIGIPIFLYLFGFINITGTKKLLSRPLDFYEDLFKNNNISFKNSGELLSIKGDIKEVFKEDILINDCNSSQYISGLMMVLPLINKKCKIRFLKAMESSSYLKITKEVLSCFSLEYEFINKKYLYEIKYKSGDYKSSDYTVPIDYSSYAFWAVANDLGANIKFLNTLAGYHPDKEIDAIIKNKKDIIDLKDNPDLLPILCIWGLFLDKEITIINFDRNRIKESNRVEGLINQLNDFGANIKISNTITINKIKSAKENFEFDSNNDHRLAMSFAILSMKYNIRIKNPYVSKKSYGNFWDDFILLGGKIED